MSIKCTDQIGRKISLNAPPKSIISLVPSLTETLIHCCDPGSVVGRTKFCIHPQESVLSIPRMGGTKHIKLDLIDEAAPDIIIANKEENTREDVDLLSRKFPVYVSDIMDTHSILNFLRDMGQIFKKATFTELAADIIRYRATIKFSTLPKRVAYLIWRKPYMTVGGDTFINHMIEEAGMINVFNDLSRYPDVTLEEIIDRRPDHLLLSSEPYPFQQKHIGELSVNYTRERIRIVDGEMFSWYGIRILQAYEYFKKLHVEL